MKESIKIYREGVTDGDKRARTMRCEYVKGGYAEERRRKKAEDKEKNRGKDKMNNKKSECELVFAKVMEGKLSISWV